MNDKSSRLVRCEDGLNKTHVGYVEADPSGRYGRSKEVLGKGAMKTVYRAFDEVLGMEVAWNQVTLCKVFGSPEELHRLYSEVHLLNNLHHPSIINFHASWVDLPGMSFNFITEMFTSGTLRQYRNKYQRVHIRAVKHWGRQILSGLAYLHQHDPPIIHRDLKCDNIFVNGHLGQVKIGDLGLAAILRGSLYAHSVIGTPEFMAPELYEEEYDELVDIYSFGMCMLEMLTSDYPYSECSNPAQIYKKVTSGKLPEAFYRIEDEEAREFVGKCLETASKRLPARELLLDPFLATTTNQLEPLPIPKLPSFKKSTGEEQQQQELTMASLLVDTCSSPTDVTITGTMNPDADTIFLKVHIAHKDGHTRNIYFPFDINNDTAMDVAMEMVKELEITDLEPLDIADMIEEEITNLLPPGKQWPSSRVAEDDDEDNQCCFGYDGEGLEDEMDDANPFQSASSRSSSHASLLGSPSSNLPRGSETATCVNNWLQGDLFRNDDDTSSMSSFKYSALSGSEAEDRQPHSSLDREEHACLAQKKFTRLGPDDRACGNSEQTRQRSVDPERKLRRMRSMVDVRSQLLHKSLVEQINNRRLFNTVGAAQNIGYHDPPWSSSSKKL